MGYDTKYSIPTGYYYYCIRKFFLPANRNGKT